MGKVTMIAVALLLTFSLAESAEVSPTASIEGLEAKFIDVNGFRTRYYELGEGEPMLLCHGDIPGGASANIWAVNIKGLARKYRVLAVDKLASGLTDNPPLDRPHLIGEQTEHMYQFVRRVGIEKGLHAVGQSFGSFSALRLALEHPELVNTLVICNTSLAVAPYVSGPRELDIARRPKPQTDLPSTALALQRMSFDPSRTRITEEFIETGKLIENTPKMKAWKKVWLEGGFLEAFFKSHAEQKEEALRWMKDEGRLRAPTLMYWGANDPGGGDNMKDCLTQAALLFEIMGKHNPKVRMITVNQAGHFHFREYPEEFNQNVIHFIEQFGR